MEEVKKMAEDLELPSLSVFGVKEEDFGEIAEKSVANSSNPDNPKIMKKDDYIAVLRKLTGK